MVPLLTFLESLRVAERKKGSRGRRSAQSAEECGGAAHKECGGSSACEEEEENEEEEDKRSRRRLRRKTSSPKDTPSLKQRALPKTTPTITKNYTVTNFKHKPS